MNCLVLVAVKFGKIIEKKKWNGNEIQYVDTRTYLQKIKTVFNHFY